MYHLKPGTKRNPKKRWNLPDRAFFGFGACHILAGVYLKLLSPQGFHAVWIKPNLNVSGNHILVTDGKVAFDFHGYSQYVNLLDHHEKGWLQKHNDWSYTLLDVDFDLLDTRSLNARKMLGPDQYLHNPVLRAKSFIDRFNHSSVLLAR